jgi:hypothetical protein
MPSTVRGIIVGLGVLALAAAGAAQAQTVSKCDAAQYKEAGKKVFCLMKVNMKAAKKGELPDAAAITKCQTKFLDKCVKAEGKNDCTGTVGNCPAIEAVADTAHTNLVAAVLSPSGAFIDLTGGVLD